MSSSFSLPRSCCGWCYLQYSGDFVDKTKLTMLSDRAGLVMDPGSKVTYNGVQIGRVADIDEVERDGKPAVKFTLDVYPKYLHLIPANVDAKIVATTVFGEKYVSMTAPENPLPQRITPKNVIDARSVTTEINTLFQTITSIAEKMDPVKVNLTLSAAAQALSGLGDKFGQSIINGNAALDEVNPRMPIIRHDIQQLATLGDTYADASPDLFDFLNNAATTAHTVHAQEKDLDRALLAAAGFGATGADIFNRGGPYLARGAKDLVPSAQLLDTYSPELFCTVRNLHDVEPKVAACRGSPLFAEVGDRSLLSGLGLALSLPGLGITAATMGLVSAGRPGRRRAEPVRLPGESAADQRARRAGRCAGLLADHHPRSLARAYSGHGHRRQPRAVQPRRHRLAVRNRVRLGPPSGGQHDQPMKITGTLVKLGIVSMVLMFFTALIVVVFGQMRFDRTTSYAAEFNNVSGLRSRPVRSGLRGGDRQGQRHQAGRRRPSGAGRFRRRPLGAAVPVHHRAGPLPQPDR